MKKLLLLALVALPSLLVAQIKTIKPKGKFDTSFAIVVDKKTYDNTQSAIESYRDMLIGEGLGAYILIDQGDDALKIRQELIAMHKSSPALEGCVLVGDVPVVMVRNAQHMSSAFKMNQGMAWERSSIPSDRFYDDFGLAFNFLKKDEKNPHLHYYSLDKNSGMRLQSDIYSARIKPYQVKGSKDKYEMISAYLHKVVAERNSTNKLDNLMMFRGHGYNSAALEAWSGEQVALREHLPQVFKAGSAAKFLGFEGKSPFKFDLLSEIQRDDLDVALFHEHGAPGLQYINNYADARSPQDGIEYAKYYARGKIRTAIRRKKDKEEAMDYYAKYLDIPRHWIELTDSTNVKDSITERNMDIHIEDLYQVKPNARFVMFDACYNGAFNKDEYVASAYIFTEGKTIVTIGNSVNSLQDKFPNEFIGLLAQGVRVGLWAKNINYLETHLVGDPTFCFAPSGSDLGLNKSLTLKEKDTAYWKGLLNSPFADVQAIALKKLADAKYAGASALLKETFFSSEFGPVRMECMKLLSNYNNQDFVDVLKSSVSDPYELVRRLGLEYIGRSGHPDLLQSIVWSQINDRNSKRVNYKNSTSISFYAPELVKAEINKQIDANTYLYDKEELRSKLLKSIDGKTKTTEDYLKETLNKELKLKERINAVRYIRNMNNHYKLNDYMTVVKDNSEEAELRVVMLEALSWFSLSYRNAEIVSLCDEILATSDNDEVKEQAVRTKNIVANNPTAAK